ncbi:hypothetical protein PAMP_021109 [Pampus punctatissimus]
MMKLLLFTTLVATICHVSIIQTVRLLEAMIAGGLGNGANLGMMAGGLNPLMAAGGGAGFIGQPRLAQFVAGVPAFGVPATIPNMYPVPAVNALPFMGVPQMPPMNLPQQPLKALTGGAMGQQVALQPDILGRVRRQIMKQGKVLKTAVDTQIPAPTETTSL